MQIQGRIAQKIPPNKLNRYYAPWHGFIDGKYHLAIAKPGVPIKRLSGFLFRLRHRREYPNGFYWHVAMDNCPLKKGDHIVLDVEPYYVQTSIYIPKKK